jgi:hypothetical protein
VGWLEALPAIGIAALLLVVPGILASISFGFKGFAAVGLAPAFSMSFIAIASTVAPFIHVRWGALPLVGTALVGVLIVWGLSWAFKWPRPRLTWVLGSRGESRLAWLYPAALAAGLIGAIALLGRDLLIAFVSPNSFSQTFDNVFHLNAIRWIQETGSASSLDVGRMSGIPFYPAGWHALASLVQLASGAPIPVAVNAANLVIGAFVWPLSVLFLVRTVFGRNPLAVFSGALLSAAFAAFPLLLLDFGVLYPNYLGLALLPACTAQLLRAMRLGVGSGPLLREWMALGASAIGVAIAHPNAFMALLAFAFVLSAGVYARYLSRSFSGGLGTFRRTGWKHVLAATLGFAAFLAVTILAWKLVRPPADAAFWPPTQTFAQAVGEAVLGAPMRVLATWSVAIFILIGVYSLVRRRAAWSVLALFAAGVALYAVVSGWPAGSFRNYVTGVWYNDAFRLAALLPMVLIPVAVAGVLETARWWAGFASKFESSAQSAPASQRRPEPLTARGQSRAGFLLSAAGAALLGVVLVLAAQYGQVATERVNARGLYTLTPDSPLVDSDEMALIDRLDQIVPPDAEIAANPWTGTPLAYAFADRKTLQLHILTSGTPEMQEVENGLRDAASDAQVCRAIQDLRVSYVLDFGSKEVNGGSHAYPGLENLQNSPAVTLVAEQGHAKLFKVLPCHS